MKSPLPTPPAWMLAVEKSAEKIFLAHSVSLSIGGEPTFVPENPRGPEWNYSAVGPQKLKFAQRLAASLIKRFLPGGTPFFSPGKLYPGEANPRWAIRILYPKTPAPPPPPQKKLPSLSSLRSFLAKKLDILTDWLTFRDPHNPLGEVWAILLDHDGAGWLSSPWNLKSSERSLLPAEGPAGLRLPLHLLSASVTRRSLTLEKKGDDLFVFFPPLLATPFLDLLDFFRIHDFSAIAKHLHFQGYLPPDLTDLDDSWEILGIASDPGVLEINIPPCLHWHDYALWLSRLESCANSVGLFSWRKDRNEFPCGSGGGNHLVFGSPKNEKNGFYENPAWLASILTYWQKHPSLSYLFTGEYVGASSQAPRPDESGIPLQELDFALADLRDTASPPTPYFTSENLRHLLTDIAGNPHRAEISIDKFYDPLHPTGLLGLLEFRAIETLPHAEWSSAVALLWTALLARLLKKPVSSPLSNFARSLHDRFFLPNLLWEDFSSVLADCHAAGMSFDPTIYRAIWDWKFPKIWEWRNSDSFCEIRRAHESWPLLAEVPNEGGTNSRFVDSSLRRIEILANASFAKRFTLFFNGRPCPLQKISTDRAIAGLRYRYANLYPALHARRPTQMPLEIQIAEKTTKQILGTFLQDEGKSIFRPASGAPLHPANWKARPPAPIFQETTLPFTRDLRQ